MTSDTIRLRQQVIAHFVFFGLGQLILLLALGAVVLLCWGEGQVFQPDAIRGKLSHGMTVAQVEGALALPQGALSQKLEAVSEDRSIVDIATSGWGRWFSPQYDISLVFDQDHHLQDCVVDVQWRLDEFNVRFPL